MAVTASFSTSGAALVTVCPSEGVVRICSMRDLRERFRYSLSGAYYATLCGDSSLLAVAASYGTRHRLVLLNAAAPQTGVLAEFVFAEPVLNVLLSLTRLVVVCERSCDVFDIQSTRQLVSFATPRNPKGVAALVAETLVRVPGQGAATPVTGSALAKSAACFLVLPASSTTGDAAVYNLRSLEMSNLLRAHDGPLALAAGSPDGRHVATASERGTLVRVHAVPSGRRVASFRRGSAPADVRCLAWLSPPAARALPPSSVGDGPVVLAAASAASSTVHLFARGLGGSVGDAARSAAAAASATMTTMAQGLVSSVRGVLGVGVASGRSRAAMALRSGSEGSAMQSAGAAGTGGGRVAQPAGHTQALHTIPGVDEDNEEAAAAATAAAAAGQGQQDETEAPPTLHTADAASSSSSSSSSALPSPLSASAAGGSSAPVRRGSGTMPSSSGSFTSAMRRAVGAGMRMTGAEGDRALALLTRRGVGEDEAGGRVAAMSVRWSRSDDWASPTGVVAAEGESGGVADGKHVLEVAVVLASGVLLRYEVETVGARAGEARLVGEDRVAGLTADDEEATVAPWATSSSSAPPPPPPTTTTTTTTTTTGEDEEEEAVGLEEGVAPASDLAAALAGMREHRALGSDQTSDS